MDKSLYFEVLKELDKYGKQLSMFAEMSKLNIEILNELDSMQEIGDLYKRVKVAEEEFFRNSNQLLIKINNELSA